jgi:hypothetical protein
MEKVAQEIKRDVLPAVPRAEFGLVAGIVSTIIMALLMLALQLIGLMKAPWFIFVGTLFGGSGLPAQVATYGIIVHFGIGVVTGVIFASIFKRYTETKGLLFGGLQLLLVIGTMSFMPVPVVGGTLLSLTFFDSLKLIVNMAIAYIGYGLTLGYVGKKYMQHHNVGRWGPDESWMGKRRARSLLTS